MSSIADAYRAFQQEVQARLSKPDAEPEEQLRGPLEQFFGAVGRAFGMPLRCIGETRLPDALGKPDFAVYRNDLLVGYIELKAPGVGADARRFKGRNREQFERFKAIPNLLYTDGEEWALYRDGDSVQVVRGAGVAPVQRRYAQERDAAAMLEHLLRDFLLWQPVVPFTRTGAVDMRKFAELLAPLCRLLRAEILESLQQPDTPIRALAQDWRAMLFPDADDAQFADTYAQTLTFALLLGRLEGAHPLTPETAAQRLQTHHGLLARALSLLTDPQARPDIDAALNLLLRFIGALPIQPAQTDDDPWLYFYEDFLAVYDPDLRRDAGAYYTPIPVVQAQVRLVDELLRTRLHKKLGFAEPQVLTLDPAMGTGTYLLSIIDHALHQVAQRQGAGAVATAASQLACNLHGFELMVGPYAVAELRLSRALCARGATLPPDGLRLYLTDTLESPYTQPVQPPLILRPIADQHARALRVKAHAPILVCLGNPPYDRHAADEHTRIGGWIRYGDADGTPLLDDLIQPARNAGHSLDLKNLYNLYVYFWRWALWKVFEQDPSRGGVVSFITAASYLDGDAFVGLRERLRALCDEVWILDLGGEGRGARKSENVFNIQTPVAIAIALRTGKKSPDTPARVWYAELTGAREQKLEQLRAIEGFHSLRWHECPADAHAPFRPVAESRYFQLPKLTDLMPWQHSGVQLKRTWPIAPDEETLRRRWRALLQAENRAEAFRETPDRTVGKRVHETLPVFTDTTPIVQLPPNAPPPPIVRYAYRTLDRQHLIADVRMIARPRPPLWRAHSEKQVYLTSLLSSTLGRGPTCTACASIPDIDIFPGSGAKNVVPLYRDTDCAMPNIAPAVQEWLHAICQPTTSPFVAGSLPEALLAYLYGVLAHPAFTERFWDELRHRELRVPLAKDPALFAEACEVGAYLLWLHTYGERYADPQAGRPYRQVPAGRAKCVQPIPDAPERYPLEYRYADDTLCVGEGMIAPVAPEVWNFEVSGLKVVASWLKYRVGAGGGKKSSPLDAIRPERWTLQFTTELLELLWVIEHTLAVYPQQAELLERLLASELVLESELAPPPDWMRQPPSPVGDGGLFGTP